MDPDQSAKLVSIFLVLSVCTFGYVSMSTWGTVTPTAGEVAVSNTVEIRQGPDVSYYFAQDAYLDTLEIQATYVEINNQFRLSTNASTGHVNITLEQYDVASPMMWLVNPGTAEPVVNFTLSGLVSWTDYEIYVDGNLFGSLTATGSGTISFSYSGPWSDHEFEVVETGVVIPEFGSSISVLIATLSVMAIVMVVAMRKSPQVRMKRGV
jgi:hypothetical protein